MAVKIRCPNAACGKDGSVAPELLGHTVRCSFCGRDFTASPAAAAKTKLALRAAVTNLGKEAPTFAAVGTAPAAMPQRIGRFQVRAIVGSGAFGVVYRAYDAGLDREVALKVPHAQTLENSRAAARFLDEGKATARLYHPHIVAVFETGSADGQPYLASAFIEGRTLAETLAAGLLPAPQVVQIIAALADALSHAHGQGIIHRDVKPANVLVDARGHVFLMDFGIARVADSGRNLTKLGDILGTPGYLSPEQAEGKPATAASDQYSLGVMLYEMLCGQRPFAGPAQVVLYHTSKTAPPLPRSVNAGVPAELEAICLKAMAKRAADRYAGCEELAGELRRFGRGEGGPDKSRENLGVKGHLSDDDAVADAASEPLAAVDDVSIDVLLEYARADAALEPRTYRSDVPPAAAPNAHPIAVPVAARIFFRTGKIISSRPGLVEMFLVGVGVAVAGLGILPASGGGVAMLYVGVGLVAPVIVFLVLASKKVRVWRGGLAIFLVGVGLAVVNLMILLGPLPGLAALFLLGAGPTMVLVGVGLAMLATLIELLVLMDEYDLKM